MGRDLRRYTHAGDVCTHRFACLGVAGPRQAAAIASVSVLATLLAITLAWGIVIIVRQQRRRRYSPTQASALRG